jgi:membrane protease YdiL (CAAX protease family)
MALSTRTRDGWALAFAMLFPVFMAWLYFVALAQEEARANPALQFAFGTGKLVQALFPILYVWWFERDRLTPRAPTLNGMALGVGFGLMVALSTLGLYHFWLKHSYLLGDTPAQVLLKVHEFNMATPAGYLAMGVFICVVHSLFEEYYWRWFVFGTLKRHLPVAAAIVLSGVGFTLHHIIILGVFFPERFWGLALPFSLCVGVGGCAWAWIYHRSGSLYASWVSHVLIDAAILLVGYDMVDPFFTLSGSTP